MKALVKIALLTLVFVVLQSLLEWAATQVPGTPLYLRDSFWPASGDNGAAAVTRIALPAYQSAAYLSSLWLLLGILPLSSAVSGIVAAWVRLGLRAAVSVVAIVTCLRIAAMALATRGLADIHGVLTGHHLTASLPLIEPVTSVCACAVLCLAGYRLGAKLRVGKPPAAQCPIED